MALFLVPGRLKPAASREHVTARYELCEDLANHLDAYAQAHHHDLGIAQSEVLRRCHEGLLAEASAVSAPEARWVIRRLAELAGWDGPEPDAPN